MFSFLRGGDEQTQAKTSHRTLLRIEGLEDRCTPALFVVNTTADTPDVNLGDGLAQDAKGNTSLRAAIMEGNNVGGPHLITFGMNPGAVIQIDSEMNELTATFGVVGNGQIIQRDKTAAAYRLFSIAAEGTGTFSNLTFQYGDANVAGGLGDDDGGAFMNNGSLTLANCTVTENVARHGGGIYSDAGSKLAISNSTISKNSESLNNGGNGGGIYVVSALDEVEVGPPAFPPGSGEPLPTTTTVAVPRAQISNSWILQNEAGSNGGGIYIGGGVVKIDNTNIALNDAVDNGGGIFVHGPFVGIGVYAEGAEGVVWMTGGSIMLNAAAGDGGGFAADSKAVHTLDGVSVILNSAGGKGGGIHLDLGFITTGANPLTLLLNDATGGLDGGAFNPGVPIGSGLPFTAGFIGTLAAGSQTIDPDPDV